MTKGAADGKLEIHGYVGCAFAWRVRLAAAEKGVEADWIPCDVEDPDPRAAEHNPDEHSPIIWHRGFSLLESAIILGYFDEAFPGRPLMPESPRARAELRFLSTRLAGLDAHTEPSRPAARKMSGPALARLEDALGDAPFLHGDEPGIVDVTWWPFLANLAVRGLIDQERTPTVVEYVLRAAARPSFSSTRPPWAMALGG